MQLVEMMLWFGTVRYVLHLERFNTLNGLDEFTGHAFIISISNADSKVAVSLSYSSLLISRTLCERLSYSRIRASYSSS
jgi:hypothetical protein